ncbi:MmyB family transcriptional regulator [Curtobacterium flaccumfaciens]|uniref:MmyB family transcriptional regulator n=1 Tax=Curtobacterium flaccumfaciens TaxID=2035 RepID=UPI002658B544|nr:hypothetical protein [Curtobacterium flaccumfaciens]MCX2846855.1 hypothetical protein [Curtobacterium flaccumfaciens pv. oortii]
MSRHIPPGVQRLLVRMGDLPLAVFAADWTLLHSTPLWQALFDAPSVRKDPEQNLIVQTFVDNRVAEIATAHGGPGPFERALAKIPKYRHPVGLRGRRDAFLVVLVGFLQLSRQEARRLSPLAIELGSIVKIRGRVIPSNDNPVTCLACAVTRWLRVAGNAYLGHRAETRGLLDSTKADLTKHDCGQPVTEQWRRATELLVPLDTYGWVRTGVPLSNRSITSIIPTRRRSSGFVEDVGPHTRKQSQFDDLSVAETYRAAGALEAKAAAMFARSAEVLAEAHLLGVAIDDLLVSIPDDNDDVEFESC